MVSDRRGLGERLKRQRERRGITLEQISKNTKVPASLFAGLEAGDCSRWPAGLYARAYLRAYAETIGLNAEETLEEFASAYDIAAKSDGIEGSAAQSTRPSGTLRLSLVEESPIEMAGLGRRAGLAAVDLLIGLLIAACVSVGLGQNVWVTVGLVLSYFVIGRVISDEPLLYFMFRRMRTRPAAPAASESIDEVAPVGDAASTTA